jgi:hypothetical protein
MLHSLHLLLCPQSANLHALAVAMTEISACIDSTPIAVQLAVPGFLLKKRIVA